MEVFPIQGIRSRYYRKFATGQFSMSSDYCILIPKFGPSTNYRFLWLGGLH